MKQNGVIERGTPERRCSLWIGSREQQSENCSKYFSIYEEKAPKFSSRADFRIQGFLTSGDSRETYGSPNRPHLLVFTEDHELEPVAVQGLLVSLEDAVKSLQEHKGLSMVMDNWAFIPRSVQERAVLKAKGQGIQDQLVAGKRFKVIYESQVQNLGIRLASHHEVSSDAKTRRDGNVAGKDVRLYPGWLEEKEVDDDATDLVPDSDSLNPVDFDSDDTVELDENEVMVARKTFCGGLDRCSYGTF